MSFVLLTVTEIRLLEHLQGYQGFASTAVMGFQRWHTLLAWYDGMGVGLSLA